MEVSALLVISTSSIIEPLKAVALIVLSPLLMWLAWKIKKNLGSPVIFSQIRPGKNKKLFRLYKFRSMTDDKDEKGNLLPDEERMTDFGRKLRATSEVVHL